MSPALRECRPRERGTPFSTSRARTSHMRYMVACRCMFLPTILLEFRSLDMTVPTSTDQRAWDRHSSLGAGGKVFVPSGLGILVRNLRGHVLLVCAEVLHVLLALHCGHLDHSCSVRFGPACMSSLVRQPASLLSSRLLVCVRLTRKEASLTDLPCHSTRSLRTISAF